jgi:hypothetical protein
VYTIGCPALGSTLTTHPNPNLTLTLTPTPTPQYLRPGTGLLLPDKAVLYLCAIEDGEYRSEKIDFWSSVYGFNMQVWVCVGMGVGVGVGVGVGIGMGTGLGCWVLTDLLGTRIHTPI